MPILLKLALIEISTRSAPAALMSAICKIFSSSAISACICGGIASQPDAAIKARASGCLILTFDSARAARPNSTNRRDKATEVDS